MSKKMGEELKSSEEASMPAERLAMYKTLNEKNGVQDQVQAPEPSNDMTPEKEPVSPPEPKEEAKKEDVSVQQVEQPPKSPSEKTVPLAALHSEREKRKEAQAKIRELEEQNKSLEDRVTSLSEDMSKFLESKADEPADDIEKLVKDLKSTVSAQAKEIENLKLDGTKRDAVTMQEQQKAQAERVQADFAKADKVSAEAGFPGMAQFKPQIVAELQRLVKEDPDNELVYDNPDGWSKIYRETIYPKVTGIFAQKKSSDKEAAKAAADIPVGSQGGPSAPPPKKEDGGPSWYIKMRQKQSML